MIYHGQNKITGIYHGKNKVIAVYKGSTLVWSLQQTVDDDILSCFANGYWIDENPWTDELSWNDNI